MHRALHPGFMISWPMHMQFCSENNHKPMLMLAQNLSSGWAGLRQRHVSAQICIAGAKVCSSWHTCRQAECMSQAPTVPPVICPESNLHPCFTASGFCIEYNCCFSCLFSSALLDVPESPPPYMNDLFFHILKSDPTAKQHLASQKGPASYCQSQLVLSVPSD